MFKATVSVVFDKFVEERYVEKETQGFDFQSMGMIGSHRSRNGMVDFAQVFCKCGHVFVRELVEESYIVEGRPTEQVRTLPLTCPGCGDSIQADKYDHANNVVQMGGHSGLGGKVGQSHLFGVKLYDNRERGDDTIRLSFLYTRYISINTGDDSLPYKIAAVNRRASITFNTRTGMGYFIDGKLIRNITHYVGQDKSRTIEYMEHMLDRAWKVQETWDLFTQFMRLCLDSRGAKYANLEAILSECSDNSLHTFTRVFHFCKYPVLQHLPFSTYHNSIFSKKVRKVLPTLEKSSEVYQVLAGHSSKKIMRHFSQNGSNMAKALLFGPLIEDSNILLNYLEMFDKQETENSLSPHNPNVSDRYLNYVEAMKFIKSLHTSDAQFMTRFVSDFRTWIVKPVIHEITGGTVYRKSGRRPFSLSDALHLAQDTYNSYVQIRQYDPEYVVEYNNDLMELHDHLPRVLRRYENENTEISYDKKERAYEMELDGITFVLAKDTHELYDIGDAMNICVGSYGREALDKECTIVLGYAGDELMICMDIWNEKLQQVKSYYNTMPKEGVAFTVRKWALQCGIDPKDSYDLNRVLRKYMAV
jgi:hypothetical protein